MCQLPRGAMSASCSGAGVLSSKFAIAAHRLSVAHGKEDFFGEELCARSDVPGEGSGLNVCPFGLSGWRQPERAKNSHGRGFLKPANYVENDSTLFHSRNSICADVYKRLGHRTHLSTACTHPLAVELTMFEPHGPLDENCPVGRCLLRAIQLLNLLIGGLISVGVLAE